MLSVVPAIVVAKVKFISYVFSLREGERGRKRKKEYSTCNSLFPRSQTKENVPKRRRLARRLGRPLPRRAEDCSGECGIILRTVILIGIFF